MDVVDVPQEGNRTLGNHKKALYAKNSEGHMVIVSSCGSEVDETVTMQAVERMNALSAEARLRVLSGQSAPLEYWMCACRMDVALLSQISGVWQWRIRRHFNPQRFAQLSSSLMARYADALGLSIEQLKARP